MDINQLRQEKEALEGRLLDFVMRELDGFYSKTGVPITRIVVSLHGVEVAGLREKRHILESVECRIDI